MSDHLPPRARAILDLARDGHDPTEMERGRVRERVAMTLAAAVAGSAAATTAQAAVSVIGTAASAVGGAGVAGGGVVAGGAALGGAGLAGGGLATGGPVLGGAAVTGTTGLLSVGLTKVLGAASLALAVAGGTAVVVKETRSPRPAPTEISAKVLEVPDQAVPPRAPVVREPPPLPAPVPLQALAEVPATDEVASSVAPDARRLQRAAPPPKAPEASPLPETPAPESELRREVALVREASAALQSGNLALALDRLNEHGKAFPAGHLATEREGLGIMVRCRQGAPGVKDAARRFLAAAPSSVLAGRIRKACEVE